MSSDGSDEMARLSHDLTRAGIVGQVKAGRVMRKALTDIQSHAQAAAPVDTGFLRSSISTSYHAEGATVTGEVGPTANYGRYVEEGTIHNRAQPYLRPATDAVLPSYDAAMSQIIDGIL